MEKLDMEHIKTVVAGARFCSENDFCAEGEGGSCPIHDLKDNGTHCTTIIADAIEQLYTELERVTAERNAAARDIREILDDIGSMAICAYCVYSTQEPYGEYGCNDGHDDTICRFEWSARGAKMDGGNKNNG